MKKKSPLHNVVYKVLQSECTILVIVIFALVAPIALWLFKLTYKGDCGNYDSNWLGFFGSYFGGILGGMATLLAVVFTIRLNKEEERQKDIRRSAFIIYLDFQFTFENIIEFVIQFWINNGNIMSCLLLNDTEFDPPFSNPIFNQFYFDPDWIKRVADLSVSSDFDSSEIKTIGEIYGHLMNIKNALGTRDTDTCKKAYASMNSLIDIDQLRGNQNVEPYQLNKQLVKNGNMDVNIAIKRLMKEEIHGVVVKLKEIAELND